MGFKMRKLLFFFVTIFLANQNFADQIKVLQVVSGPEVTVGENQKIKLKLTLLMNCKRILLKVNIYTLLILLLIMLNMKLLIRKIRRDMKKAGNIINC